MSDEITPQAKPIDTTGEPEWFPPAQDDSVTLHRPEPSSAVRRIFFGRDGMRAGWALLLWLLFAAMLARGVNAMLRILLSGRVAPHTMPEWLTLLSSTIGFFTVGAAGLIVSRIERKPWSAYGIGSPRSRTGDFGMGLLWGFGTLSVLVGMLRAGGYLAFSGLNLHGVANILLWAVIFALSFLMTGFFEEFTFRGFPQFTLTRASRVLYGVWAWKTTLPLWPSGSRPACSPSCSVLCMQAIPARAASVWCPQDSLASSSPSVCGAPDRYGGPLASTRRGTGRSPTSTGHPIAASCYRIV